jgi:hypothetical protein
MLQTNTGSRGHGHARRAQAQDRHDEVDAAQDRRGADHHQPHDPQVLAGPALLGDGRVAGPAGRGGTTLGQQAGQDGQPAHRQPERQRVDAREGHVQRADLQRHHVVPEADQHRKDEQEDHERAVQREQLVVAVGGHQLPSGRRQLGAHQQREDAGHEEEREGVEQIQDADPLVVGGGQPLHQPVRLRLRGQLGRPRLGDRHPTLPLLDDQRPDIAGPCTSHWK